MPTYTYECESCLHSFNHFQTMTSNQKRKCPECGKPKLVRRIGPGAGVIFKKGSGGFYSKDYSGRNASDGGS